MALFQQMTVERKNAGSDPRLMKQAGLAAGRQAPAVATARMENVVVKQEIM